MKIKERVLKESIKKINKRLSQIDFLLDGNFLSDIIDLRKEVYPKIQAQKDITDPVFMKFVSDSADKEKKLLQLAKKQNTESMAMIDEKVKLTNELCDLKNELYRMGIEYKKFLTA